MLHLNFDFPDDPEYWSEKYRTSLSNPHEWILVATSIIHAMDCLRPAVVVFWKAAVNRSRVLPKDKFIHGVYLMLASYACENLLKALLVAQSGNPDTVS